MWSESHLHGGLNDSLADSSRPELSQTHGLEVDQGTEAASYRHANVGRPKYELFVAES